MEIKQLSEGFKGIGDNPIIVNTTGWEKITNKELFTLIKLFYENEERIYPKNKGYQGGNKIRNAIYHLLEKDKTIEEITKIANEKNVYSNDFGFNPNEWSKVFCDHCGTQVFCPTCNKYVWIKK